MRKSVHYEEPVKMLDITKKKSMMQTMYFLNNRNIDVVAGEKNGKANKYTTVSS